MPMGVLVAEGRKCEPELVDSMVPPFGWNYPPRVCLAVPETVLQRVYAAVYAARVDRVRIHDPGSLPSGIAIRLDWGGSHCQVGAVEREAQVHREDRRSFGAGIGAIESILPP